MVAKSREVVPLVENGYEIHNVNCGCDHRRHVLVYTGCNLQWASISDAGDVKLFECSTP